MYKRRISKFKLLLCFIASVADIIAVCIIALIFRNPAILVFAPIAVFITFATVDVTWGWH